MRTKMAGTRFETKVKRNNGICVSSCVDMDMWELCFIDSAFYIW